MPLTGEYDPSTQKWVRDQVELYETSGGTEGTTLRDTGLPVVILTSVGASSGKLRKTGLMRVEHDGVYAVVASQGGAPKHPSWYFNVREHPLVELQDGPTKRDYRAREVTGDEKAVWWERAVAAYPPYAEYQRKTDREIPVFVLEPVDLTDLRERPMSEPSAGAGAAAAMGRPRAPVGSPSMFVSDLALVHEAEVVAVGSRQEAAAAAFAERSRVSRAATARTRRSSRTPTSTSSTSRRRTRSTSSTRSLAIDAGKHVLVEKPFTMDAAEARVLVAAARAARRVPDGGDVDALPAAHRRDPRAARRGRARRDASP